MLIADAQQDLRRAYVGGGPGVFISGLVWSASAIVERGYGVRWGYAVLFFGGMLIFPGAKLVCRALFRRPNEAAGNPFGMAVMESTIAMMGGLFAAWLVMASNPAWVFPLAAIAVGTHYFLFRTVYGDRLFWLLAAMVAAVGFADIFDPAMRGWTASLVAAVELVFGLTLMTRARTNNPMDGRRNRRGPPSATS